MEIINGSSYKDMIHYGINHLDKYCAVVNDLNVFPVPDGDTGTNMVMTMRNGFLSIGDDGDDVAYIAKSFANGAVFGARGNSGVIVSQFFKGLSKGLQDTCEADCATFSKALGKGCEYAYASVAKPVEGTILTVLKDATGAVSSNLATITTFDELLDTFLREAKISLENTPNLLPILSKAGVVDSGGAGIVYFFEGMQRYLKGEELESVETQHSGQVIDYTAFNKDSCFDYGYCTETLLQLTCDTDQFDYQKFVSHLQKMGDSVATSLEGDKVHVHVHTHTPEEILRFCHRFGEFLNLKIENMSVQHTQTTQKFLCSANASEGNFSVVAVAPNAGLQSMLSDMGADVVILSEEVPSSQDFIEAFEKVTTKEILVFPNSSNSILSAMQAGSLYKHAKVIVLNCRSIAECYSALAYIDFEGDINDTIEAVDDTIGNIYEAAIIHAAKNIQYGNRKVVKNDYFALAGDEILFTSNKLESVVMLTVADVVNRLDRSVLNLFYGQNVSRSQVESMSEEIEAQFDLETCVIPTQNPIYDLVLSFE